MSVRIEQEIVGIEEATQELDRLMAAEQSTPEQRAAVEAKTPDDSAQPEAQRAAPADPNAPKQDEQAQPAPQAADAAGADSDKSKVKVTEPPSKAGDAAADSGKSRYAKAQERLQGGWTELNASKLAIKAEQEAWQKQRDAEKAELQAQRDELERERTAAEGQFSPDQYESAAKKFESEGKLDLADLARERAAALRKNPPAKAGARQEAARKEWALKAGQDFPDVAKENSPTQVRVAQLLNEEPAFKTHPKGIYVAARIAHLEQQAAASATLKQSLETKDKELAALKQKVTELEGLTAVGGGNGVTRLPAGKSFDQMTGDEQLAVLERDAREMGTLGR